MVKQIGAGDYMYEVAEGWGEFPVDGVVSDVATDSQDRVYAAVRTSQTAELKTGVILVFDRDGNYLRSWGEDLFTVCHGLWISPSDEVFHADAGDHTVTKFDTDGNVLMTLGTRGPGWRGREAVPFADSRGAVDVRGHLRLGRLPAELLPQILARRRAAPHLGKGDPVYYQREVLGEVTGTPGTGPGEFNLPHDITVDRNDLSYVQDRENLRCQVFDPEGNYLTEWKDVQAPNDAVIDEDDVMHIAEGMGGILIVKLDGEVIGRWGKKGDNPGDWRGAPTGCGSTHAGTCTWQRWERRRRYRSL